MQATMELINTGTYVSWSLPYNTSVVLTSNPDDSQYSVSSLDSAQKTRFVNFNLKSDSKAWASWAEGKMDGRAINFALYYWDEIFKKHNGVQTVNPRSYVTFCKAIGGIKNWSASESLALILQISKGCFLDDKDNIIGGLFTTFINNHLDRLIQPEAMLKDSWDSVKQRMINCVYEGEQFKPEIASILAIRLLNYVEYFFENKGESKVVEERLLDFIDSDKRIFSEDLFFHLVKNLIIKYPNRTNKLIMNSKIRDKVLID